MKGHNLFLWTAIICMALSEAGYGQVITEWTARYNGTGWRDDRACAMAVGEAGEVYVTGGSVGANGYDYVTIRYSLSGNEDWVARYNGPGNGEDAASAVTMDGDGNVYVTGWSDGAGSSTDYATLKYNAEGQQQWVARYNGPGNGWDEAFGIVAATDGNIYVTGASIGASGYPEIATVKYDVLGNELWVSRYNRSNAHRNEARALAIDSNGNAFIAGWTQLGTDTTGETFDFVTLKYNSAGGEEWVQVYDGPAGGCDRVYALRLDPSGNVVVAGLSENSGSGLDFVTIKYNSSGQQQWIARYNGTGNGDDAALALELDAAGNAYVTGMSQGSGTSWDYTTIKYNSDGQQQWASRLDGPGNADDMAFAIKTDSDGNAYVTGASRSGAISESADYATVKYSADGEQKWVVCYNGPDSLWDEAYALCLDEQGNIYVTGLSCGDTATYEDYLTIRYTPIVCEMGDVICDGQINVLDVLAIVNHILGIVPLSGDALELADCNGDAVINILDALGVVNVILGIIPECPGSGATYKPHVTTEVLEFFQSLRPYLAEQDFEHLMNMLRTLDQIPGEFVLLQNYPNPFNPVTTISYSLPVQSEEFRVKGGDGTLNSTPLTLHVTLKIFNVLGQEVATLVDEAKEPGYYTVTWNAGELPSGVYFYRLTAGGTSRDGRGEFSETKRMVLMK